MKEEENRRGPREIFWPAGADATCPGPLTDPEGSSTGLPRHPEERPREGADVRHR